ncbi:MAG: DUF5320 family protein [Polaribacter sp.]|uniref:DUF5320 family protein n=1 Tax=Polaribacter sp. TaxID=1920175 RepID=UPI003265DA81
MPNLNHQGPEGLGPKTGMKLGKCRKSKLDNINNSLDRPYRKGRRKKKNNRSITTINS